MLISALKLDITPLHQINTVERETKRHMMVYIINTPVENNVFRLNPYSSSGIYMTSVIEAWCLIVAENRRKQHEVKENLK